MVRPRCTILRREEGNIADYLEDVFAGGIRDSFIYDNIALHRQAQPRTAPAVEHGIAEPSPLLIIAGAGTGQTNTLAHRVAHLIGRRRRYRKQARSPGAGRPPHRAHRLRVTLRFLRGVRFDVRLLLTLGVSVATTTTAIAQDKRFDGYLADRRGHSDLIWS